MIFTADPFTDVGDNIYKREIFGGIAVHHVENWIKKFCPLVICCVLRTKGSSLKTYWTLPLYYLKELGVLAVVEAKQVLVHLQQVKRGKILNNIDWPTAPISLRQGSCEPIGSLRACWVLRVYSLPQSPLRVGIYSLRIINWIIKSPASYIPFYVE